MLNFFFKTLENSLIRYINSVYICIAYFIYIIFTFDAVSVFLSFFSIYCAAGTLNFPVMPEKIIILSYINIYSLLLVCQACCCLIITELVA